ncbi:MAG: phage tail protein [Rickettsiaceae bacterium]|jgi:hypothetical protein|nr:phage tail protein [Rickettsiaceae bacterium]
MTVFSIDVEGNVEKIIADFNTTPEKARLAALRALNKTAFWLRTHAGSDIAREVRLPKKLVMERIKVLKASRTKLQAVVTTKLYGIKPDKIGNMRQSKTGAKVGSYEFTSGFIATMPTGHTSIYRRKRKSRLPIQEMTIPLEPMASSIIENYLDRKVMQRFEIVFRQELNFLMRP